jgi:hypothetical protein
MTYLLDNTQKIEILNNNCIPFTKTKNTLYVDGFDVTNTSDESFTIIVLDYIN